MDYPDSYYSATMTKTDPTPVLEGGIDTDVCVVGGGYAGLTTALELARRGIGVCLLEANTVGWGASGRNGGFVSPGFAESLDRIIGRCGLETARELFDLSREGTRYIRQAITEHLMEGVQLTNGYLRVQRYPGAREFLNLQNLLADKFNYQIQVLSIEVLRETLHTELYHHAWADGDEGFHIHPLNYALGLAKAAQKSGACIYEHSPVLAISRTEKGWEARTGAGCVRARHMVQCGSAYMKKGVAKIASCLLPVSTYVVVTEPLGERLNHIIRTPAAILDTRRASDYYRIVGNDRLMWGGRITTRPGTPSDLAEKMKKDIRDVYPQLGDFRIEYAWQGTMGYAPHKMPLIGQMEPGLWAATAFGGHGINTSAMAGLLIARAIAERDDRYKLFSPFPIQWAGGLAGRFAVQLSYWGMQWQDRMAEREGFFK